MTFFSATSTIVATFYVDLAKRAAGPVLDIGCGTGRIMLPCLQAGVDIDGLDLFDSMLARLRELTARFVAATFSGRHE